MSWEREQLIHALKKRDLIRSFEDPISEELESFLVRVKRAQLVEAMRGPTPKVRSWRVVWFQNPDRGNVWEGRVEDYERQAEEGEKQLSDGPFWGVIL